MWHTGLVLYKLVETMKKKIIFVLEINSATGHFKNVLRFRLSLVFRTHSLDQTCDTVGINSDNLFWHLDKILWVIIFSFILFGIWTGLWRELTGAGPCLAFVLVAEAGWCSQQAAGVKQTAAVLMRRWERVGGIRRYGMVGWGGLRAHGGQAAPQRTGALHLHPFR